MENHHVIALIRTMEACTAAIVQAAHNISPVRKEQILEKLKNDVDDSLDILEY